jgi:hypothetical protein
MMGEGCIEKICSRIDQLAASQLVRSVLLSYIGELDARRILEACLLRGQDESYLSTVCGSSYAHPNGFSKLTLVDRNPAWSLRLHVWPRPVMDAENDCHNHRGYLVSRVIRGKLVNELYTDRDDLTALNFLCYEDRLDSSMHHLEQIGVRSLALDRRETICSGDTYFLDGLEVHRSVPLDPFPVVTIVLQGPVSLRHSLVYRRFRRPSEESVSTSCSAEFFMGCLIEVLGMLTAPAGAV